MKHSALRGWRSHAWAWVVFVALLKGLVPHAALASVAMTGQPGMVWCAPGAVPAASTGAESTAAQSVAQPPCACAAFGDGAVFGEALAISPADTAHAPLLFAKGRPVSHGLVQLPPARGPPGL